MSETTTSSTGRFMNNEQNGKEKKRAPYMSQVRENKKQPTAARRAPDLARWTDNWVNYVRRSALPESR